MDVPDFCSECAHPSLEEYCFTCRKAFCVVCVQTATLHWKGHRTQSVTTNDIKNLACVAHGKMAEKLCLDCQELVCVTCLKTGHHLHDFSDDFIGNGRYTSTKVEQIQRSLEERIEKLDDVQAGFDLSTMSIRNMIKLHKEQLMKEIDRQTNDLLTMVTSKGESAKSIIDIQLSDLRDRLSKLKEERSSVVPETPLPTMCNGHDLTVPIVPSRICDFKPESISSGIQSETINGEDNHRKYEQLEMQNTCINLNAYADLEKLETKVSDIPNMKPIPAPRTLQNKHHVGSVYDIPRRWSESVATLRGSETNKNYPLISTNNTQDALKSSQSNVEFKPDASSAADDGSPLLIDLQDESKSSYQNVHDVFYLKTRSDYEDVVESAGVTEETVPPIPPRESVHPRQIEAIRRSKSVGYSPKGSYLWECRMSEGWIEYIGFLSGTDFFVVCSKPQKTLTHYNFIHRKEQPISTDKMEILCAARMILPNSNIAVVYEEKTTTLSITRKQQTKYRLTCLPEPESVSLKNCPGVPVAVHCHPHNGYIITTNDKNKLALFDKEGNIIWTRELDYQPKFMTADAVGQIYISDGHTIHIHHPNGEENFRLSAVEHLKSTAGVCVDPNGNILVSDPESQRVVQFNPDGRFIRELFNVPNKPSDVAIFEDTYLAVGSFSGHVFLYLY